MRIKTEAPRWLFEGLQQAVGPFGVQKVGIVDHGDLTPAHVGAERQVVAETLAVVFLVADQKFQGDERLVAWAWR